METTNEVGSDKIPESIQLGSNRRSGNKIGLAVMLIIEMLEGVACYTILPYLVVFCKDDFQLNKKEIVIIYLAFSGVTYMVPCVSGAISDTILTRYTCTLISLILFLIGGLILLGLGIFIENIGIELHRHEKIALFIASLVFIGLGYGFLISLAYPLGINQLANPTPRNVWSFFIWKHWFYCFGKLLSYLPLPYILRVFGKEKALLPKAIVVVVSIGLAIGILLLGKPWINIVQPQGKKTFARLRNGCSRFLPCLCKENLDYDSFDSVVMIKKERLYSRFLLKNVVLLSALFSVFGAFNVFRTQLSTAFVLQAENLRNSTPFPDVSINTFSPIIVLLCVPLIEIFNRLKPHWENMTNLDIAVMVTCPLAFASLCASILQTYIITALVAHPEISNSGITLFAQGPQYVLIGLADVIGFIPGTEFAYKESLQHIEGFTIGMMYSAGSFLSLTIFVTECLIFNIYISDNLLVQIKYHFYVLTGTAAFFVVFLAVPFIFVYRRFKERSLDQVNSLLDDLTTTTTSRDSEETQDE